MFNFINPALSGFSFVIIAFLLICLVPHILTFSIFQYFSFLFLSFFFFLMFHFFHIFMFLFLLISYLHYFPFFLSFFLSLSWLVLCRMLFCTFRSAYRASFLNCAVLKIDVLVCSCVVCGTTWHRIDFKPTHPTPLQKFCWSQSFLSWLHSFFQIFYIF